MGFGQPVPRKKDPREITPTPQAALPAHLTPAALSATYGPQAPAMQDAISSEAFMTALIFGE